MQRFKQVTKGAMLLATAGVLGFSAPAMAGGFASARLGGLHANPVSISPTSVYWNPGAIGKLEGTRLYLDAMGALRHATYTRINAEDPRNNGEGTLGPNGSNFIVSPGAAFTTDFGGKNVVLGAGFYVPYGGQTVWGKTDIDADTPEYVADGPQRWFAIDGSIRQLTGTLGAAVRTDDKTLSAGLMLNLNIFQINTLRARVSNGSDDISNEGRSHMEASGIDVSIGVGAHWNTKNDRFALGLSFQSGSDQTLKGTLVNQFGPFKSDPNNIYLSQAMPHIARLGLAYRFINEDGDEPEVKGELRLTGEIQTWNRFKSQCIATEAAVDADGMPAICDIASDGTARQNVPVLGSDGRPTGDYNFHNGLVQNLVRDWRLSYGLKVSGSYYLNPRIELGAGLGYDANAIPSETLDPALFDMDKISIDLGGNFEVAKWLAIMVQVTDVIYMTRDTSSATGLDKQPLAQNRQPSGTGQYTQNIFITNLGLHFKF